MAIFTNHTYSLTNSRTITRIAKYNAKLSLVGIYHDKDRKIPIELAEGYNDLCKLSHLPNYLAQLSRKYNFSANKQFFINCTAINSNSLYAIFPAITPTQKILNTSKHKWFFNSLSEALRTETDGPLTETHRLSPTSLERKDALLLIASTGASGAVELQELNIIVFEINDLCFYLTYGDSCRFDQYQMLRFDLDDGFILGNRSVTEISDPALQRMQRYFNDWKAENYENDLFSAELAICESPLTNPAEEREYPSNEDEIPSPAEEDPHYHHSSAFFTFDRSRAANSDSEDEYDTTSNSAGPAHGDTSAPDGSRRVFP